VRTQIPHRREHQEAITRLQAEHKRLGDRINVMYIDKLDGKIGGDFYDRFAGEWREEQLRLQREIDRLEGAEQSYMDEDVQLLELARNAQNLFAKQEPREKRRLLNFLLSNCTWEDGEVVATFRQPFDLLAETNVSAAGAGAGQMASSVKTEIGSPGRTGTARVSWDCHAPSYHDAREAVIRPSPIFW
jgi:site-specific DNA recombinase